MELLEVDGVPTLLAPTGGPIRAGLAFRVGTADETLARSGVTHLLEHLALAPLGLSDYHFNGSTMPVTTVFHTQGSESDVATFLTAVCRNLHALPTDRLAVEKEILRTEWSSRGTGAMDTVPLWRHGARDHGLVSYPEWGLGALTAEDLQAWAARFFTRGNAVLWIAGDRIPAGLRLPLPEGGRQPVPAASSALPQTPAYFVNGSRAVALDAVVRRRTAASVFAGVLERELYRALRQDAGLSYTTTTGYGPRGDGHASLQAIADALPEKQEEALGGFVDVLAKLRAGRFEQADLDATIGRTDDFLSTAEASAARLSSQAFNLLTGAPLLSVEEYRAELKEVSPAELTEVAEEAMATALLMVPQGCRADWAGFTPVPTRSTGAVVTGTAYREWEGEGELRVGADGVSHLGPDGPLTVRYAECAVLLAWPDGARQLIGTDAISLRIEPTLYDLHPGAIGVIDAQVPAERQVAMPARAPEQIPYPSRVVEVRPPAPPRRRFWEVGLMTLSGLAALVMGVLSALLAIGINIDNADDSNLVGIAVAGWVLTVILALPVLLLWRRRT